MRSATQSILFFRFPYESAYGGEEKVHLQMAKIFCSEKKIPLLLGSCNTLQKLFHQENFLAWNIPMIKDITSKKTILISIVTVPLFFLLGLYIFPFFKYKYNTRQIICMTYIEKVIWTPLALLFGYKVFWSHHAPLGDWFYNNPYSWLWKFFSSRVRIITPSKSIKNELKNFLEKNKKHNQKKSLKAENIQCVYNPITVLGSQEKNKKKSDKNNYQYYKHKIGTASRLSSEKNIQMVLLVAKKFPDILFSIAGTGSESIALHAYAKKNDIKNIEFLGFIPQESMKKFFQSLDLFLLPSLKEPFGLVAGEAMYCGIPVLVSDVDGIGEVVGKYGEYFNPESLHSLESQIQNFLNLSAEEQKNRGAKGKNHIIENFSFQRFEKKIKKVFA